MAAGIFSHARHNHDVIPAKAGISVLYLIAPEANGDSRFRGNDVCVFG